jgi:hypothetical protein
MLPHLSTTNTEDTQAMPVTPKQVFSQPTEGYGQLSISTSGVRPEFLSGIVSEAAGVWGVIGATADVDKAKPTGPQDSAAIVGYSTDGHAAVIGNSKAGIGVQGISHSPQKPAVSGSNPNGLAGSFTGNVTVSGLGSFGSLTSTGAASFGSVSSHGDATVGGQLTVAGVIHLGQGGDIQFAGDCAEQFDVAADAMVDPGTVMVLGESERVEACDRAYDTRVAGVVSGAGEYRPALVLDQRETCALRRPLALIGKVYCKVDAEYGAIAIGDLLTTSPTQGHAMKACDSAKAFGTTIGKALRAWSDGRGMIPVLVALS